MKNKDIKLFISQSFIVCESPWLFYPLEMIKNQNI